ncbi:MAG: NAD-dependent succinate-semialdehyde dehydrogenase [Acidobacteria bacterium]|nr:NAD-dependent succinate-semialdehyde dehydrogenase [Acidobacteriota bacterium]
MDTARLKLYINGEWREAASGATIEVCNPATREMVCRIPYGGAAEAASAVEAAAAAFPGWAGLSAWERSRRLRRVGDLIRERKEEYARWMTLEMGKPIVESRAEVNATADYFEWYSEEAKRVYGDIVPAHTTRKRHWVIRQPLGVAAAISPWNFPSVLPARKISAALAAGCTMVVRPATQTPLSSLAIVQACEDAGVPPGVINLILGPSSAVGPVLLSHPAVKKVSLTGSVEVGRIIARDAGAQLKKVALELGGSAPILIFEDADVETAARQTARAKFRNMGQVCISITRIFVQESIRKKFEEILVAEVRSMRIGDGLDESTELGPLANEDGLKKTREFVADAIGKGARLLAGGGCPAGFERGYFYEPAVLTDVPESARVLHEEPFGPIAPVCGFRDFEEAIARANATPFGLAGYLFTSDLRTAILASERLECGIVGVNDLVPATAQCPFGGIKDSGYGREGGYQGLDEFLYSKYISIGL